MGARMAGRSGNLGNAASVDDCSESRGAVDERKREIPSRVIDRAVRGVCGAAQLSAAEGGLRNEVPATRATMAPDITRDDAMRPRFSPPSKIGFVSVSPSVAPRG